MPAGGVAARRRAGLLPRGAARVVERRPPGPHAAVGRLATAGPETLRETLGTGKVRAVMTRSCDLYGSAVFQSHSSHSLTNF